MIEKKVYHEVPAGRNNFHSAILTTFSFNFHHFEFQVLNTLKRKSIYNIGVLVDSNMLDKALGVSSAGLKQLTQTYSINGVYSKGAFHPKLNFLIGDNHLMLILGSGNITAGGHGKNHETFTTIYADSNDSKLVPILNEAWGYLQNLAQKLDGYSHRRIYRSIPHNCSILSKPPIKNHQFYQIDESIELALIYNSETSIFNQIIDLVPNNEVNSISIVSPYYDEDGELLVNLLEVFKGASLNVYLPSEMGLPPNKIIKNSRINFYEWESTKRGKKKLSNDDGFERKLHSKLFFFHGTNEEYCLLGSANATIAAFGNKEKRGVNDEFGVMYKSNSIDFLNLIGVKGEKVKVNPEELKRDAIIVETAPITEKNKKLIKVESCDLDGLNLKIHNSIESILENVYLQVFDDVGELILESNLLAKLDADFSYKIDNSIIEDKPAYVLFCNEDKKVISNKQVINYVDKLFNTDPSKENRAIRSIRSALEMGEINEYKLLGYLNELNDRENDPSKKSDSSSQKDKIDKEAALSEMTFEEAIEASKKKEQSQQLSTKHHAIQFWQTITSVLKDKKQKVTDDLNDEEEDGEGEESKERNVSDIDNEPFTIKNGSEFKRIINRTITIKNSFVHAVNKYSRDSNVEIDELILCHFLLISHIITVILKFNTYELPVKEGKYTVYSHEEWCKILDNQYSGQMQEILIAFSKMVLTKNIINVDGDEYRLKNLNNYIQETLSHMHIYHYLINRNQASNPYSELTDLACLNILLKIGGPNEDFLDRLQLISKSKTEELFNTNNVVKLKKRLELALVKASEKEVYFIHQYDDPTKLCYGVCLVKTKDEIEVSFKSILEGNQKFSISINDLKKL